MKRVKIWNTKPLTFTARPGSFHDISLFHNDTSLEIRIIRKSLFLRTCHCENSTRIVWHHPRMKRRCLDHDIGPSGFNAKKSLRFCILSTPNTSSILLTSFNPSFLLRELPRTPPIYATYDYKDEGLICRRDSLSAASCNDSLLIKNR